MLFFFFHMKRRESITSTLLNADDLVLLSFNVSGVCKRLVKENQMRFLLVSQCKVERSLFLAGSSEKRICPGVLLLKATIATLQI